MEKDNGYEPVKETDTKYPRRLPSKRKSEILKLRIGNNAIYLGFGEYRNGELGEIFVDLHKEGTALRSMFNCFAIAVSLGLQYGVPLKTYVDFFKQVSSEPNGIVTGYDGIKRASSIVSLIFRIAGKEYINRNDYSDEEGEL